MFTLRSLGLASLLLLAGCPDKQPVFTDAGPTDADVTDAESIPVDAGTDAPVGSPGQATVTGAVKASSASYKLYGTLRSGDGSSESANYQRRGGVTGATQP